MNVRLPLLMMIESPANGRRNIIRRGEPTVTTIFTLCPACNACPTVEIDDHEVRIGEGDNVVTLTPAEWDVLVQAIKAGELNQVDSHR